MADQSAEKTDDSVSMQLTCFGIRKRFPEVSQLSTGQLAEWIKNKKPVTIFDTRPEEEYQVSKIEGAVRLDPSNMDQSVTTAQQTLAARQTGSETAEATPLVCYCSVGYRSSKLAQHLKASGKFDSHPIYNLEGSLFKWANEDREVVDSNNQPTRLVHPYSSVWGRLLDASRRFYA